MQSNSINDIEFKLLDLENSDKSTILNNSDNLIADKTISSAKKYYDKLFSSDNKDKTIITYQKAYRNIQPFRTSYKIV